MHMLFLFQYTLEFNFKEWVRAVGVIMVLTFPSVEDANAAKQSIY